MSEKLRRMWFRPLYAELLQQRRVGMILGGIFALQLGLHLLGLPGWVCPIKAVTGFPCPGCGLTEAMTQLLQGHWRVALADHAFAPVFLLAGVIILASSIMPEPFRLRFVSRVARLEERTGMAAFVLISLIVYWGFRLTGLA